MTTVDIRIVDDIFVKVDAKDLMDTLIEVRGTAEALASHLGAFAPDQAEELAGKLAAELESLSPAVRAINEELVRILRHPF